MEVNLDEILRFKGKGGNNPSPSVDLDSILKFKDVGDNTSRAPISLDEILRFRDASNIAPVSPSTQPQQYGNMSFPDMLNPSMWDMTPTPALPKQQNNHMMTKAQESAELMKKPLKEMVKNKPLKDIWSDPYLSDTEKLAVIKAKQGDFNLLESL